MKDDTSAWPIMLEVLDCLRERIADAGVPEPSFIGMLPGAVPLQEWAAECGGQAWVRLVTTVPSVSFPDPDRGVNTFTGAAAATIEVGISRCAPGFQDRDALPGADVEQEATRLQLADMQVLYLTLACCFADRRAVLGAYTPIGQTEGVIGGTWAVTVEA